MFKSTEMAGSPTKPKAYGPLEVINYGILGKMLFSRDVVEESQKFLPGTIVYKSLKTI